MTFQYPRMHSSLLTKWIQSSRSFAIEYGGFLSNHLTHNMVAIACSEHSEENTEKRLRWWYEVYTPKLEPAATLNADSVTISEANWLSSLTNNTDMYPAYLAYYDRCVQKEQGASVLRQHLPFLMFGLSGAALHPIIHTGWSIEAKSDAMLAEGLAYMSCRFVPLVPSEQLRIRCPSLFDNTIAAATTAISKNDAACISAVLAFAKIALDSDLYTLVSATAQQPEYEILPIGSFQRKMRAFSTSSTSMNLLIDSTLAPRLVSYFQFVLLSELIDEVYAVATSAYLSSNCEFFVLHGVTSLHGVVACVHLMGDTPAARGLLLLWLQSLLAVFVCQGLPGAVDWGPLLQHWNLAKNNTANLDALSDHLRRTTIAAADCINDGDDAEVWWRQMLEKSQQCEEEHVSKVVYVMWRWATAPATSTATSILCRAAAANQMREKHASPADNIWFGR